MTLASHLQHLSGHTQTVALEQSRGQCFFHVLYLYVVDGTVCACSDLHLNIVALILVFESFSWDKERPRDKTG